MVEVNKEELAVIRELEKLIGKEFLRIEDRELGWSDVGYRTNEEGRIAGISLHDCGLKDISLICQLTNLTELRLDSNKLTIVPDGIRELKKLTSLELDNNQLTIVPEWIRELTNLTELRLDSNQLTNVPEWIRELTNLTELRLDSNQLTIVPEGVRELKKLTRLDLDNNQLTIVPEWIRELTSLTVLFLSDNQLTSVPEGIYKLTNLTILFLSDNQLTSVPEGICKLTNLTALYLHNNQLTSIPEGICKLANLTELYLSDNQLTSVPEGICKLANLTALYLSSNQLTSVPESIRELTNLTVINLNNNQLTSISEWILELHLSIVWKEGKYGAKGINVYGNPLEIPPVEIVKKGKEAVKRYFEEANKGTRKKYEAKLLILGDGNEGKTCVSRALRGLPFEKQHTTHGVDVEPWPFQYDGKDVTLNIWDFEGQEINHQSHQFFLTRQSLYLLVFKCRDQFLLARAEYWLDTIKARAPKSRVAIVISECGGRTPYVPQDKLEANYKDTLAEGQWLFAVECDKNKDGIPELQDYLKKAAMKLEHMGQKWANTYTKAEKAIKALAEKGTCHITRRELDALFGKCGISKEGFEVAAIALATLGIITHFSDCPDLKSFIILKPQWLTKAISLVMEDKQLDNDKGEISYRRMRRLWDDNGYAEMYPTFHNCMKEFELCYDMEDNRNGCLVPLRFGYKRPEITWTVGDHVKERRIEYKLNIRPPMGIMSRFIVKAHHMIHKTGVYPKGIYWHNGVFLRTGEGEFASEALCEFDNEEKILSVEVRAAFPQNLIEQIHGIAKAVFSFYTGMKPERSYGCIKIDKTNKVEEQCSGTHPEQDIYYAMDEKMLIACSPRGTSRSQWHKVDPFALVSGYSSFGESITIDDLRRELDKLPQWANQFPRNIMELMDWAEKNSDLLKRIISGQEQLVPEIGQLMELKLYDYLNHIDKMLDDRQFASAPGIILIEPVDGSKWNPKTYFEKEYKIIPFCECRGCKHPRIDIDITFKHDRSWWVKSAPIIAGGTKVLSIGLVAACAGAPLLIGMVGYEAVKYQLDMSKELAKKIELKGGATNKPAKLTRDVLDAASDGRVGYFDEPVLREQLSMFLQEIAPANYQAKKWGTLQRRRMPDNSYRWVCDECFKKGC